MKERVLADFLEGRTDVAALAAEFHVVFMPMGHEMGDFHVEPMEGTAVADREGLIRVCDAVLDGALKPEHLEQIGDCLQMSESFEYPEADRGLLADVTHWWGSPEICVPLNEASVRFFRDCLQNGTTPFDGGAPES